VPVLNGSMIQLELCWRRPPRSLIFQPDPLQVLLRRVGLLPEQHDAVPLGLFLPAAVAVGTPLVGGEPVIYHLAANGQIDFLEVKPATNGAAADRMSPFTNWTRGLSVAQVQARLARAARGIGSIVDLRVASRGASHRVTDLEIVGTNGTAHVRGGRIRSALGLREQLFVIDREYDDDGRVSEFVFTGRGWGHGVGMCQVGAYGLAKQGFSAEQIIKTYYTGVELTRMY